MQIANREQTENRNRDQNVKQKKKKIVTKWTYKEKSVTETFFEKHIKKKIAPKKNEVIRLMELNPTLFKNRTWEGIKAYICNKYNKN